MQPALREEPRMRRWLAALPLVLVRVVLACATLGAALCGPASAAPAAHLVRLGAVPILPAGTLPAGGLAPGHTLQLTVALRPRSPESLAAAALAVSDPGSGSFRRYLTPAQFARRFAPAPAVIAAVQRSLRAHGLPAGRLSANGLSLSFRAGAGSVERAFSTVLAEVRLPGGTGAVVNSSPPALDPGIAPYVQAVIGLSSLDRAQPGLIRPSGRETRAARQHHIATGGPQPCAAASAAAPGQQAYTTDQIASAYQFSGLYAAGDQGQGITVAVYELEPNDPGDIAAYQACYGTHATVSYVPVDGGAGLGAGSGEAALDIEQVIGFAPRARVLVYRGPNSASNGPGAGPYDIYSTIVSQDRAQVVTTSWGQCEPLEGAADAQSENALFEEAALQGQSLISATGDSGSEDCDQPTPSIPDTRLAVDDPASQPFVTAIGGTTLSSLGPPPSESTWNNGDSLTGLLGIVPGAGGGGVSTLWPMPRNQAAAAARLNVRQALSSGAPCSAPAGRLCRQVPDVSADADPRTGYLFYYNGAGSQPATPKGWQGTGGTSGAAPLWAALVALADAAGACHSIPLGFLNPVLYRLAGSEGSAVLNDVTTGNNDYTGTNGGRYPAGPGYDMATGLGTPKATQLAGDMCTQGLRLGAPHRLFTFRGRPVSVGVRVSDATGAGLVVIARGLPDGLRLDPVHLLVSGRPRRLGVSQVLFGAADAFFALRLVRFPWTVDAPPRVFGAKLWAAGDPSLRLTVRSGSYEPGISSVTLRLPAGLSWSRAASGAASGAVRVTGPQGRRMSVRLARTGGRLTLLLRSPSGQIRITVRLGRQRTPARLGTRGLRLGVQTLDAGGQRASSLVPLALSGG